MKAIKRTMVLLLRSSGTPLVDSLGRSQCVGGWVAHPLVCCWEHRASYDGRSRRHRSTGRVLEHRVLLEQAAASFEHGCWPGLALCTWGLTSSCAVVMVVTVRYPQRRLLRY